ncbi:Abi family protein [Serratia symbiotica]|uniref:Abi family protein n=1 Tax=Serratia symbiotica TaxID=138074 RepID=UPI00137015D3|nr:Abi family protein [Serratia symbiotica]MBQ0955603.1 Abi family protein [Serratia symbiotica]
MFRTPPINTISHINDITHTRLTNYKNIFSISDESQLHGIYSWNEEVAAKMMYLTGMIEVTLRNRIHKGISKIIYNKQSVYCNRLPLGNAMSCDWYNHFYLDQNRELKRAFNKELINRQGKIISPPPLPHKVISSIENGKWFYVLKVQKALNGKKIEWNEIFPEVFINYKTSLAGKDSNANKKRNAILNRLKSFNKIRNRCAHFEPVWKFGPLLSELDGQEDKPKPTDALTCLARLKIEYRKMTELLNWISPDMSAYYKSTRTHQELTFLISQEGLDNFRDSEKVRKMTLSKISRNHNIKRHLLKKESVLIQHKGKVVGRFHPW